MFPVIRASSCQTFDQLKEAFSKNLSKEDQQPDY